MANEFISAETTDDQIAEFLEMCLKEARENVQGILDREGMEKVCKRIREEKIDEAS